ncbi:MAG: cell wall hydrolase [Clostridia bacterium]|nr:cell wall hydrolase [Clostridia bacterium]MBO5256165.1 cell wall hydrolase [Clostridia bacterium]
MIPLLLPEDADYLARALTAEYAAQELPYAALVGIAAVVLNRVEDDRYPDSAAAVLSAWESEPFSLTQNLPDDPTPLLTDACRAAADGADPTDGSLHFEILEPDIVHESPYYSVVIDNVAFW